MPVYGTEGLRVSRILAKPGEEVAEGDVLFSYDEKDLEKIVGERELAYQKSVVQYETMTYNDNLAKDNKATQQKRASLDLDSAKKTAAQDEAEAQNKLNEAISNRDNFPSKIDYVKQKKERDAGYLERIKAIEEREALGEDVAALKEELSQYTEALKETLKQQWEAEKKQLDAVAADMTKSLQDVEKQNEQRILQAERNLEDSRKEETKDSSLKLTKMEREAAEKELALYKEIKENGGIVKAEYNATVLEYTLSESERVADAPVVWLLQEKGEVYFEAVISKEDKKYVAVGDEAKIKLSGSGAICKASVSSIKKGENEEEYVVQLALTEGEAAYGESGSLDITKKEEKRKISVPLQALHKENGSYYVFTVSEQKTILGTERVVTRKEVTVADKNDKFATLGEGDLTEQEKIVTYSDKIVKEGDVVRLTES